MTHVDSQDHLTSPENQGENSNADCAKAKPRVLEPAVNSNKGVSNTFISTSEKKNDVYIFKFPRCNTSYQEQEQIDLAKVKVDQETRLRDAIQLQIQEKRDIIRIHGLDCKNATDENREARSLLKMKRDEINSLTSLINNTLSYQDVNEQLEKMEHAAQDEALDSEKEEQIISKIEQLIQHREELLAFFNTENEIKQALQQRDEDEKRLRILKKEVDILKDIVVKAEAAGVEAEKKCDSETRKMKELQAKCRAANEARQSAYVRWQSLRTKFLKPQNKHFYKYKDDLAAANRYALKGDKQGLHRFCMNQIEKFMEIWNTNVEFRQDYVKYNSRSTLQRLGTLDGRSLGYGEKYPVDMVPRIPAPELNQQETIAKKLTEPKKENLANKKVDEEAKKSKEEFDLTKMAEEMLRREDAEAEKREQCRLEELAKVEVEKEKARKKRLRKNEKKKANKAKAKDTMESIDRTENHENAAETSKDDKQETSAEELTEHDRQEEAKELKQEFDLSKESEVMMKTEEDEAEKEEQHRLEELAKADVEAQKEEEAKEKARRKRLRKKGKKKAKAAMEAVETAEECSIDEVESAEKPRRKFAWIASVVPPSLRNCSRRRIYQWLIWTGFICIYGYIMFRHGDGERPFREFIKDV